MTQLVLDPPPPTLRLVASNTAEITDDRAGSSRRYRHEAVLGAPARTRYHQAIEWSLRHGASVNPDALRVVLAARQDRQAAPMNRFTVDDVWRLMMVDVVAWCRARRLEIPSGGAHALSVLIASVRDDDDFHPDSDDLAEVEQAVHDCTGGWTDPEHPTSARRHR